jgi:hypothetical protein
MLQQIQWGRGNIGEALNPFDDKTHTRSIRFTLDMPSLQSLQRDEQEALDLLIEFAGLDDVDILSVEPGALPYIEFGPVVSQDKEVTLTITTATGYTQTSTNRVDHLRDDARRVEGRMSISNSDVFPSFDTILRADAHVAFGRDLFVTMSPWLLNPQRAISLIQKANPCTPSEAVRLLGLLLRTRNKFIFFHHNRATRSFDGAQSFYFSLSQYLVPNIAYQYVNLGNSPSSQNVEPLTSLLHTIELRCRRALQARDFIGEMFYKSQNSNTRAMMIYHFDYASLLLSGALDSLALYIYRLFGFTKPKDEKQVGIGNKDFKKELSSAAPSIHAKLMDTDFVSLRDIIAELRNTIHADTHGENIYLVDGIWGSSKDRLDLAPPLDRGYKIWTASQTYTKSVDWGIYQDHRNFVETDGSQRQEIQYRIEPYTCAQTMTRGALKFIDELLTELVHASLLYYGCMSQQMFQAQAQLEELQKRRRILLLGV